LSTPWTEPALPTGLSDHLALIIEGLCRALGVHAARERSAAPLMHLAWVRLRRLSARFAALVAAIRAGRLVATRVYWKPVWHVLSDGDFTLILANAAHVRNVPGRKTDVADALWLADLLAHGLIRASFVPETATQAMRALLRTRKQLVREQASHVQRIQKTLEDANLKLGSVLTQIMGVSGRAILQALIDGERDPDKLLTLVQRGVKAPAEKLRAALQGRITDRHRFLLRLHLRQVDALDAAIAEIDAEVDRDLNPFRQAIRQLRTIPGVTT
jgi:transposase